MGRWTVVTIFSLLLAAGAFAAAPDLRDQMNLAGNWPTGGTVPDYFGTNFTGSKTYERTVTVPSNWSGKTIKIYFGAVQHKADVYVNDQLIGTHIGGWAAFDFDITSRVSAGQTFTLKVIVNGSNALKGSNGYFIWPVGGWSNKAGIADDVYLRAYGAVHIEDAFIKTLKSSNQIQVEYTVKNSSSSSKTVTLIGDCVKSGGSTVEKTISSSVTLAAGERKTVTVSGSWTNPTLYFPDSPQLYHLKSRVVEGTNTLDQETRRFGFREITIVGNQLHWNGVRINLYGDYQSFSDTWYVNSKDIHNKTDWPSTVDAIKGMNIRCLRWHHNSVPAYILEVCDEKGLLICDESPNWARDFLDGISGSDQDKYVANFKSWCGGWIKKERNHPSIYIWNATNEMTYGHLGSFPAAKCRAMGDEMRKYDTTRPVGYDGDTSAAQETYNYHYPEGYNYEPTGNVYTAWAGRVKANQPTGSGEMLHAKSPDADVQTAVERNKWWLGVWTRGLRYQNFTDIRPACFWFANADLSNGNAAVRQRGINLRNAYDPVALFDRAYDELGLTPFVSGTTAGGSLPSISEGSTQNRTLVLYNDEFANTTVNIECLVRIGTTVYASGTKQFTVALGEHASIPVSFQAPYIASNQTLEWVLRTYKNNTLKFEEVRKFNLQSTGANGASSSVVTINGGTNPNPNQAPSVSLTAPANGATYTAPASITLSANASDSDGSVTKVEFFANGTLLGSDSSSPYSYTWTNVVAGSYTITAKAFDDDGATKISTSVSATVNTAPPPPPTISVTSLTLVNADTDADIQTLNNGTALNLSLLPARRLAIRANTNPATVGSVRITYDGGSSTTQNGAPYSYPTDNGGDYAAWTPTVGSHNFVATPFSLGDGGGTAGANFTVNFTVTDALPFAVEITSVASGKTYSTATAKTGALQYTDRTYTVTSISTALNNGVMIRQANDDKLRTGSAELKFSVNAAATVYVCYDKRGTKLPTFLTDGSWTKTTETLSTTDTAASAMVVYKKSVPAGSVTLGGNRQPPADGAWTHYIPIVKPASASREAGEDVELAPMGPQAETAWDHAGDTDGDGLFDDYEVGAGMNPFSVDGDGNGIADEDEFVSGTTIRHFELQHGLANPNGGGAQPGTVQPLTITKLIGAAKFKSANADSVSLSGVLTLPAAIQPAGLTLSIDVGGAVETFALDGKGRAKIAQGSVALKLKRVRDRATKALSFAGGAVPFSAKLRGSYSAAWVDEGFTATESVKAAVAAVAVRVTLDGEVFEATANTTFAAKAGNSSVFKGK